MGQFMLKNIATTTSVLETIFNMYVPSKQLDNNSRVLWIDMYVKCPNTPSNSMSISMFMNWSSFSNVSTTINQNFKSGLISYSNYINSGVDSINTLLSSIAGGVSQSVYLSTNIHNHTNDQAGITLKHLNTNFIGAKSVTYTQLSVIQPAITIG